MTVIPHNFTRTAERARIRAFNPLHAVHREAAVEETFRWAVEAINDGRAPEVVERLKNHPERSSFALIEQLYGNALKYVGRFDEAEEVLQHALAMRRAEMAQEPSHRSRQAVASTLGVLGEVAFCRRDISESEHRFAEAIAVAPWFWIPHLARLCLASTTRDTGYCNRVIDDLVRDIPGFLDDPAIIRCLAEDGQLHFVRTHSALWARLSVS